MREKNHQYYKPLIKIRTINLDNCLMATLSGGEVSPDGSGDSEKFPIEEGNPEGGIFAKRKSLWDDPDEDEE